MAEAGVKFKLLMIIMEGRVKYGYTRGMATPTRYCKRRIRICNVSYCSVSAHIPSSKHKAV